jgi:hypothetical protein
MFSTLGGAIGSLFFRNDGAALPGEIVPPPLPPE